MSSPEIIPQIITVLCATVGGAGLGTIVGYSSPAGSILRNGTGLTEEFITENQNSWVSSVSNLGAVIAAPLTGAMVNYFGRRKTIIFAVIPVTIGWILIASAQGFVMLLLGRIISGMYCSLSSITVPAYVGEISSPHIRGTLGSVFQFMIVTGILYAYIMGAVFKESFRWLAGMCALVPCLCSALMIFQKESPYYLVSIGQEREAEEALRYFRGKNYDGFDEEMKKIKSSVEEVSKKKAKLSDLKKPYNRKPFVMSLGLFFFQQFVGIGAVLFNMVLIFQSVGSDMGPNTSSIIVGVVQVAATGVGVMLVDRTGRRVLLIASSIGMILSHIGLGIYFYFLHYDESHGTTKHDGISWLPLLCLVLFIIAFNIGFGPIPWLMAGELFSPEVKDLSASIATMCNWTFAFIVTATFEPLQDAIHDYGTYWMFAIFCLLSLIFSIFFVYETKGKTLQEINQHFGLPQQTQEKDFHMQNGSEDKYLELETVQNGSGDKNLEPEMP